jgi:carbon monoxide dehydrogenase subunit G
MLAVKRQLDVAKNGQEVWAFVKDMGNWASQMPGYISHEMIDENDSAWTVQVNIGPFTKPFVIDVHVTRWLEPSEVTFDVRGRHDPFRGAGSFRAHPAGARTVISLEFEAVGTGSMAKVVTAMAAPVLDYVANEFSANLARVLGGQAAPDRTRTASAYSGSLWGRFLRRLRAWFKHGNP